MEIKDKKPQDVKKAFDDLFDAIYDDYIQGNKKTKGHPPVNIFKYQYFEALDSFLSNWYVQNDADATPKYVIKTNSNNNLHKLKGSNFDNKSTGELLEMLTWMPDIILRFQAMSKEHPYLLSHDIDPHKTINSMPEYSPIDFVTSNTDLNNALFAKDDEELMERLVEGKSLCERKLKKVTNIKIDDIHLENKFQEGPGTVETRKRKSETAIHPITLNSETSAVQERDRRDSATSLNEDVEDVNCAGKFHQELVKARAANTPLTLDFLREAATRAGAEIEEMFRAGSNNAEPGLTYVLVFPSGCRMALAIPTLIGSYLHQKDELDIASYTRSDRRRHI